MVTSYSSNVTYGDPVSVSLSPWIVIEYPPLEAGYVVNGYGKAPTRVTGIPPRTVATRRRALERRAWFKTEGKANS